MADAMIAKVSWNAAKTRAGKAGVTPHLHVQVHPKAVVKVTDESTVFSEGP